MYFLEILFNILIPRKLAWRIRFSSIAILFYISKKLFQVKYRLHDHFTGAATFFSLLRLTIGAVLFAIITASILLYLDWYITLFLSKWYVLDLRNDQYSTFLATIAATGGVFIALYYAAVSTIAGTIYARAPNNVRELLAQERIGNVYMRFLAFVTFLAVVLLACSVFGFSAGTSVVPVMAVLSGVSIIAFVRLGARAFDLFDPTTLANNLFYSLRRDFSHVMAGRFRWSDKSFQYHAYKSARAALDTLSTLAAITEREPHLNGRPLAGLCKGLLVFLCLYERAKKRIPTTSLWYGQKYAHPDWYKTSDSTTQIASQTATSLQPEKVPDRLWVEKSTLKIINRFIEINLHEERFEIINEIFQYIDLYVKCLLEEGQIARSINIIESVASSCSIYLFAPLNEGEAREPLERLAIAERLASLPISVLLTHSGAIDAKDREAIISRITKIDWGSEKDIYVHDLTLSSLCQLEWLWPRLNFEIRVHGRQVSPDWYVSELVLQGISENAKEAHESLVSRVTALYQSWIDKATKARLPWVAAAILSRELGSGPINGIPKMGLA